MLVKQHIQFLLSFYNRMTITICRYCTFICQIVPDPWANIWIYTLSCFAWFFEYISDIYTGPKFLQNLKTLTDTHCSYLFCTGSQFMVLNSFIPTWDLFSRPKQKCIHLFWADCILFVRFLFRFGYHAEHA